MIKVRSEAIIHRPVGEVFGFVTDVSRFGEWVTGAVENQLIRAGPMGVGSSFHQIGEFMGKRFEMDVCVTHFEPDHRFSYKSRSGPLPFEQHYRFVPEGDDTRLTVVVVGETKGFLNLFRGAAERVYQLQLEGDLIKLEQILLRQLQHRQNSQQ